MPLDDELATVLSLMEDKGLEFPIVAKPDIGWNGFGVRLVADKHDLSQYIAAFPRNEKIIFQRPVPHDGEAGVFYARIPGEPNGRVCSVALGYFPFVIGDGKSTLRQLVKTDKRTKHRSHYYLGKKSEHVGLGDVHLDQVPGEGEYVRLSLIGSLRIGGLYLDASHLITPELNQRFDAIAKSMPEFHFGRFDIRFESLDQLVKGDGFSIIEI